MNNIWKFICFCFLVTYALGFVCGGLLDCMLSRKEFEREAVAAGVAHYTVDPKTGEVKFVYEKGKP